VPRGPGRCCGQVWAFERPGLMKLWPDIAVERRASRWSARACLHRVEGRTPNAAHNSVTELFVASIRRAWNVGQAWERTVRSNQSLARRARWGSRAVRAGGSMRLWLEKRERDEQHMMRTTVGRHESTRVKPPDSPGTRVGEAGGGPRSDISASSRGRNGQGLRRTRRGLVGRLMRNLVRPSSAHNDQARTDIAGPGQIAFDLPAAFVLTVYAVEHARHAGDQHVGGYRPRSSRWRYEGGAALLPRRRFIAARKLCCSPPPGSANRLRHPVLRGVASGAVAGVDRNTVSVKGTVSWHLPGVDQTFCTPVLRPRHGARERRCSVSRNHPVPRGRMLCLRRPEGDPVQQRRVRP